MRIQCARLSCTFALGAALAATFIHATFHLNRNFYLTHAVRNAALCIRDYHAVCPDISKNCVKIYHHCLELQQAVDQYKNPSNFNFMIATSAAVVACIAGLTLYKLMRR